MIFDPNDVDLPENEPEIRILAYPIVGRGYLKWLLKWKNKLLLRSELYLRKIFAWQKNAKLYLGEIFSSYPESVRDELSYPVNLKNSKLKTDFELRRWSHEDGKLLSTSEVIWLSKFL